MSLIRLFVALAIASLGLSGCMWAPGQHLYRTTSESDASQTIGGARVDLIPITPELIANEEAARETTQLPSQLTAYQPEAYRIGPGDTLYITVWDHPELTVPAGQQQQATLAGRPVQSDGVFFYPYVGKIRVEGKTPQELRDYLTSQLAAYVESPQVDVSVLTHASQRIWVTGAVTNSEPIPLGTAALTLNDAISQAGLNPTQADVSALRLTRDGITYVMNIDQLGTAPIYLKTGDRIYVPFLDQKEVFVLGEVNLPGAYSFRDGSISLSQALGRARGLNQTTANGDAVYVIRGAGDFQQEPSAVYALRAKSPAAFAMGSKFQLLPGDVVFVGASGITRWNRFVSQLLPFSGILNNASNVSDNLQN